MKRALYNTELLYLQKIPRYVKINEDNDMVKLVQNAEKILLCFLILQKHYKIRNSFCNILFIMQTGVIILVSTSVQIFVSYDYCIDEL